MLGRQHVGEGTVQQAASTRRLVCTLRAACSKTGGALATAAPPAVVLRAVPPAASAG